ncbi:hypothetical protein [Streptomyces sp. SID8352]|uniref:hypothetical protein n=1 Tax=Streptomyces sp. SID8352 TaxID=2690338 RepID=UPI00136FF9A3|nr:hypothetical protein [Streptomyces sp. SID8352]MYU26371.1 hypothetical protein [Streptomyces sp. SID8352]
MSVTRRLLRARPSFPQPHPAVVEVVERQAQVLRVLFHQVFLEPEQPGPDQAGSR